MTGTEVLTGRVTDRNGPWLSERLRELGVDHAYTLIVGDRREDMDAALRFLAARGVDVVVTSGGLGPTADDLTAEVVGRLRRAARWSSTSRWRSASPRSCAPLMSRWPDLDPDAIRAANRKQAVVPEGATVLEPVGTAPGLVVRAGDGDGPTIVVLPGPPRELQPMWPAAVATEAFRAAVAGAVELRQEMLRLFGIPESEIAETLRLAEDAGIGLDGLEITTCLRRGEIEVVTRFAPAAGGVYDALRGDSSASATPTRCSPTTGARSTSRWPTLLRARGAARSPTAESCTGGLLAGAADRAARARRTTSSAGSSSTPTRRRTALAGVDPALIERVGAVSPEVAEALADGARRAARRGRRRRASRASPGPGGGTEDKPVGLVCFSVAAGRAARLTRTRAAARRARRRARPLDHRGHAPRPPAAARRDGERGADRRLSAARSSWRSSCRPTSAPALAAFGRAAGRARSRRCARRARTRCTSRSPSSAIARSTRSSPRARGRARRGGRRRRRC